MLFLCDLTNERSSRPSRQSISSINDNVRSRHVAAGIAGQEDISLYLRISIYIHHWLGFGTYGFQLRRVADSATRNHIQPLVKQLLWLLGKHCNRHHLLAFKFYLTQRGDNSLLVMINPGEIQLTLAKSVHSTAKLLAKCTAAALDAL